MASTVRSLAIIGLLTILNVTAPGRAASAQEPSTLSSQDLAVWARQLPTPGGQLRETAVARQLAADAEMRPFSGQQIVGLAVNGLVRFTSDRGLVRIVLVDDRLREHLVYETYPLVAPGAAFQIRNACRETCLLPPTVPSTLKVELVDASLEMRTIVMNQLTTAESARAQSAAVIAQRIQSVKEAQESEMVAMLNRQIKAKGLKWIAGDTEISRLSYAEKRRILAPTDRRTLPNLQGAEYYKGGILEVRTRDAAAAVAGSEASSLIDAFDWRSRHGANRPGSPYYDGDPTGSGWMTSIKSQRCADCWAHSALGATEALVNLYFNQHVDANLSEQELVSCSGAGGCSGGNTGAALSYVQNVGVVDEPCFPESGIDEPCNVCPLPQHRFLIAGFEDVNPRDGEDNIKRWLIRSGPLPFGIPSWWHTMVLAGYQKEADTGATVWILKNSWGASWGEQGYGYLKVGLDDIYLTYHLRTPVVSLFTPYTVACRDADGDGYFNWGISDEARWACPDAPAEKDCDDSDPTLALMTEDGACTAPPQTDTTAPAITIATTPATLWPPNGRMVPVTISGTITDSESGVDAGTVTYAVNDEYGRIRPTGGIVVNPDGSYTFTLLLQAARRGSSRDGRHYTITVSAKDRSGNSGSTPNVVWVPHDMRATGSSAVERRR